MTRTSIFHMATLSLALLGCGSGSGRLTPSFVAVHNAMRAMGMVQSGEISEGSLDEGGTARFTMQLSGGECYTIVAFGAGGVHDIDVSVTDESGTEVATDRSEDAQAAAQFCPSTSAEYQVAVTMEQGSGSFVVSSWSGGSADSDGAPAQRGGPGTCSDPIQLALGSPVRGTTAQGQSVLTGSCIQRGGGNAPERVYRLTMEQRSFLSVTMNSDYDGALYLLGACDSVRSEIACNDDHPVNNTRSSHIETTLDPGEYFLVVDGYANETGGYEIVAETTALQGLSQVCGGAQALTAGRAVTGSTAGQPSYFTATCAGGARSPDRLYTLAVPNRSRLRVRMQSTYDGAVYVRRSCSDPNSEVACNDDHRDTRHSLVTAVVDPGNYFVFVDGYADSNAGDYSLRADLAPTTASTAAANNCSSAGTFSPGTDLPLDTFMASDDFSGSCGGRGAPDVVYQLNVTARTRLQAALADAESDMAMYIQRQCGQTSSEVACAQPAPAAAPGGSRSVTLDTTLQPGNYFLVVDGASSGAFGAARLETQVQNLQELDRVCRAAPRIRPGRTIRGDTSSSRDRFQASCASNAESNDMVYRLVLRRRSRVQITSAQQYDGAIYIRSTCTDPTTEVACNDDSPDNRHSAIDTTLDPGTYYVFMDGFGSASQGAFTMDVDVSRATGP